MSNGRPKSAHDNVEMPLRCEWPRGCDGALWANAATGRRDGILICDSCNKTAALEPPKTVDRG